MKRGILVIVLFLSLSADLWAQNQGTPQEYANSPYNRSTDEGAIGGYRGSNIYGSESGDRGAVYPNQKRSLVPATYLNPDTGVPAYLNYAGTVNTYVGSLNAAAGLAAGVASNLSGSGFVGAGQAMNMAQMQQNGTIGAVSNMYQAFMLDPSGQSLRYEAFANSLARKATGDPAHLTTHPPMDPAIAANITGGRNLLPGQAAALASVPSGVDAVLGAANFYNNPNHMAHSPLMMARETAEFASGQYKFFGLSETGNFDAGSAVNAWFKQRLSDFVFNENHENAADGTPVNAIVSVLNGPAAEIWKHKRGWWALFGDVLYGLRDDLQLSGSTVANLVNGATQRGSQIDIAPQPGPVVIMDGILLDSIRSIATILNARCSKINESDNDNILDPSLYGAINADFSMGVIEKNPDVQAALRFLKTDQHTFQASDTDVIWRSVSSSRGSGYGACGSLTEVISNPATLLGKVRGSTSSILEPWESSLFFYAEQITNFKFDMSVKYATDEINRRMTSKMLSPAYGQEALRLIDKSRNAYYISRERFHNSLQGLYARFQNETSQSGAVGSAFQPREGGPGTGQLGG